MQLLQRSNDAHCILLNGQCIDLDSMLQWYPSEDPVAELDKVEGQVERVSAALTLLLSQVRSLKAQINHSKSPFLRILPPEIISEIFVHCVQVSRTFDELAKVDSSIQLRLGAVCSTWRSIAWSTPQLWASVSLQLCSALRIPVQAELLREWLARSGHLALSIWISSSEDVPWAVTNAECILKAINDFSKRWQKVDIRLPSACYRYLPPPEEHFPLLESITIRPPGGQGDRTHRVNIFDAPRLTHLSLQCLYLRSIRFNWELLTTLELESFYIDESLEMLRQATTIVDLTLRRILGGDDRHALPDAPIVLPSLKTLKIANDKATDLSFLIAKINSPCLRELSYSADNVGVPPIAQLIALLTESQCTLDTLSLSDCALSDELLQSLLSATPTLKHLHLNIPAIESGAQRFRPLTDSILEKFDPVYVQANEDASLLLPSLEVLSYSGLQSFSWSNMLQMIHSRMTASLSDRPPTPSAVDPTELSADPTSSSSTSQTPPPAPPPTKDLYARLRELDLRIFLLTHDQVAQIPEANSLHNGTAGLTAKLETVLKVPSTTPTATAPTTPNNEPAT